MTFKAPTFRALVLEEIDGKTNSSIQHLEPSSLPAISTGDDVLVRVSHSSLNYKDGLAITGTGKIIRKFPMVPGIDFAGVVEASSSDRYKVGDQVVLTGWGVGERHWGGLSELARVKSDWLVPLPKGLSAAQAMGIGTAGFTAMLCVMALERAGLEKGEPMNEVVVTGAAGGVGSVAVMLLAKLGHQVTASTGRGETHDYLREIGASEILERDVLAGASRPLETERFSGAVDTVGGTTLAGLIARMKYNSSIAACGLAGGAGLTTTVMPFILRGVNLLGVESVMVPYQQRLEAWDRLAKDLPLDHLERAMQTVSLEDVPRLAQEIIAGQVRGRVVVDLKA
jgi:acrylyl-CoA reductase (NADPH)